MRTIKLTISYDGTRYKGWQVQPNGITIQEEIEKSIERVFGKHARLHGAGRTDSGVHAKFQTAHFKTTNPIHVSKIPIALNSILPDDIAIIKAEEKATDFHARFNSKAKIYKYTILNAKSRDPFAEKYSWRVPYKLNVALMKREAEALVGKHDFKSFQATDKSDRESVRKIFYVRINKKKNTIVLRIEGNGFLYNMVRNITGTLVDIGRGYLAEGSMNKILKSRDRKQAGPTAPPQGLFLEEVKY